MQTFRLADSLETSRLAPDWQAHSRPAGCDRHTDRPTLDQQPMHAHWVFTRKSSSCKQLNLPVLITFTAALRKCSPYTNTYVWLPTLTAPGRSAYCAHVCRSTYALVYTNRHISMCMQICILVCVLRAAYWYVHVQVNLIVMQKELKHTSVCHIRKVTISLCSTVSQALERGWNETLQITEQGCTGTRLELNKARIEQG